jgi:hyperosmotically inducible protein
MRYERMMFLQASSFAPRLGTRRLAVALWLVAALLAAGCAGPRQVEREPALDARLATQVKIALVEEGSVDAAAIFVDAKGGVIRLGGFADSAESRERAMAVARQVPGVKSVQSEIALR